MTELAVRDGVASVMVKDYAKKRGQALEREFGTPPRRQSKPTGLADLMRDFPQHVVSGSPPDDLMNGAPQG